MNLNLSWKWIPMILMLVFILGFALFEITGIITLEDSVNWIRSSGLMAGLVIFILLLSDIVLPVPSSVLMTLAGGIYGMIFGTIIAFAGSLGASFAGFFLMRRLRKPVATRLLGIKESLRMERWFRRWGEIGIILSRMVPVVTETMSCLAGLSRITWQRFLVLASFGTLPMTAYYAYVGSTSKSPAEWMAHLALAFVIPIVLWAFFRHVSRRSVL